jgi:N-acetylneuraminic acid mutarotase
MKIRSVVAGLVIVAATIVPCSGFSSGPELSYAAASAASAIQDAQQVTVSTDPSLIAEPEQQAYWNYCGPGATRVLLSHWLQPANLPTFDTLGWEEDTNDQNPNVLPNDGHLGTYTNAMVGPINNRIPGGQYTSSSASTSEATFDQWMAQSLRSGVPMITGLYTRLGNGTNLPGWNHPADHIVTVYGYDLRDSKHRTISYIDTASLASSNPPGSPGSGPAGSHTIDAGLFFRFVSADPNADSQIYWQGTASGNAKWYVTLTARPATTTVGNYSTLTATSLSAVFGGKVITIVDQSHNVTVKQCSSTSTCSTSIYGSTAGSTTYVSRVQTADGTVLAQSSPLAVTWQQASLNTWDCSQGDTAAGCATSTIVPMPTARNLFAGTLGQDGRIYAIGGWNYGYLNTVEAYDSNTNTWSSLPSMPTARYYLGAASANGRIYAIGGTTATQAAIDTAEAYDPTSNSWSTVAPMPTAREALAVVAASNGKIFAIGGYDGTRAVSTVEVYDPVHDSWSAAAPMPTARFALAAAIGPDGRIYAVGGTDGTTVLTTVEAYDISTNTWTTVASMLTGRRDLAAASSGGRIFAIGGDPGTSPSTISSAMEAYAPGTSVWANMAPMPTGCDAPAAVTGTDGRIYVLGGTCGTLGVFAYFWGGVQAYSP